MSAEWKEFLVVSVICVLLIISLLATAFRDG